jgi:hypothetical protein
MTRSSFVCNQFSLQFFREQIEQIKCNSQIERKKSFFSILRVSSKTQQSVIECRYRNVTKSLDQISFDHYTIEFDSKNILDRLVDDSVFQRFLFSRDVIINRRFLEMRQMMNFTSVIVRFRDELKWKRDEELENIVYLCDSTSLDLTVYIICNYVRSFINEDEIFTQNQLRRVDVLDFCITLNYVKNDSRVRQIRMISKHI